MYFLELEPGMMRIILKASISRTGPSSDASWQQCQPVAERLRCIRLHNVSGSSGSVFPARCSAIASSAIFAKRSCELANSSCQRCSERSSSSIHAANVFCSSAGRCDASSNACWRSWVILRFRLVDFCCPPIIPTAAGRVRASAERGISSEPTTPVSTPFLPPDPQAQFQPPPTGRELRRP